MLALCVWMDTRCRRTIRHASETVMAVLELRPRASWWCWWLPLLLPAAWWWLRKAVFSSVRHVIFFSNSNFECSFYFILIILCLSLSFFRFFLLLLSVWSLLLLFFFVVIVVCFNLVGKFVVWLLSSLWRRQSDAILDDALFLNEKAAYPLFKVIKLLLRCEW